MRILIVDDDYVTRSKLKALLAVYGDCDVAPNGRIALEMFECAHAESFPYQLITLDVELGDCKGDEVLGQIRAWEAEHRGVDADREASVLMVTVVDDPREVMKSYKKGCEDYLVKPFNAASLYRALSGIGICR